MTPTAQAPAAMFGDDLIAPVAPGSAPRMTQAEALAWLKARQEAERGEPEYTDWDLACERADHANDLARDDR